MFVRLFYFLLSPDRILIVPRNVRYPPRTTSWSPAGREVEWLEEDECVWGARAVSLQWRRDQDKEKKPDEKKLELIGERGSLEADRRTEKKKKNAIRTRNQRDRKKRKRKQKRQRKKKWKRKKSTKVGIHIPPSPTALEYKNTKKDFLD